MAREAAAQLENLGLDDRPAARLGDFPIGVQQLVELARVLFSGARIIILDEPTSALSPPEIARLFDVLRRVRDSGRSLVFISHFLDDILRDLRRSVSLPQRPRVAAAKVGPGIDKGWIIERMIGAGREELEESYLHDIALKSRADAPAVLEAHGLTLAPFYRDVSSRRARRRSARHLRLHGVRADRTRAHPFRQAQAFERRAQDCAARSSGSPTPPLEETPASAMSRKAGARCCSGEEPIYQQRLDRLP